MYLVRDISWTVMPGREGCVFVVPIRTGNIPEHDSESVTISNYEQSTLDN